MKELIACAEAWPHLKKRPFEEIETHQNKNESDHEVDAQEFVSDDDLDPELLSLKSS